MKKFNAIRLLEEEKENNYLLSVNIPKKQYADKFNKFINDYVYPKIEKLDIDDENLKEYIKNLSYNLALNISNIQNYNSEDNKMLYKNINIHILRKEDIGFINKDKKTKDRVSIIIINSIIEAICKSIDSND